LALIDPYAEPGRQLFSDPLRGLYRQSRQRDRRELCLKQTKCAFWFAEASDNAHKAKQRPPKEELRAIVANHSSLILCDQRPAAKTAC
jgi:hypothetical protein